MLHVFFDDKPWFAPKRYGYGAGLPVARQGWVLVAAYIGVLAGIGQLAQAGETLPRAANIALLLIATALFLLIVKRRTAGGWKWRWGKD